jgi:hypothetical protein
VRSHRAVDGGFELGRAPEGRYGEGSWRRRGAARGRDTVGEVLERIRSFNRGAFFAASTPREVADAIERRLDDGGIDGINLRQFLTPGTAEDFIELVVPELRRRGRYRESYGVGETLRERLFGAGNARLLPDHPGARYRGAFASPAAKAS